MDDIQSGEFDNGELFVEASPSITQTSRTPLRRGTCTSHKGGDVPTGKLQSLLDAVHVPRFAGELKGVDDNLTIPGVRIR